MQLMQSVTQVTLRGNLSINATHANAERTHALRRPYSSLANFLKCMMIQFLLFPNLHKIID